MNWTKYLGVAVVVSVVVNLLLAGFIIGRLMPEHRFARGHFTSRSGEMPPDIMGAPRGGEHGKASREGDLNIMAGVSALSPASRDTVREIMRKYKDEARQDYRVVREKRKELLALLSESPENVDKIEAVFDELAEVTAVVQKNAQSLVLEIARELPESERAAFLRSASSSPRMKRSHP